MGHEFDPAASSNAFASIRLVLILFCLLAVVQKYWGAVLCALLCCEVKKILYSNRGKFKELPENAVLVACSISSFRKQKHL